MLLIALLVALVKLPLLALKAIVTNKVLLVVAIAVILVVVVMNAVGGSEEGQQAEVQVPYHQLVAPSAEKASFAVKTYSRLYYADEIVETEDTITLIKWYSYNGESWQLGEPEVLPLNKRLFGARSAKRI